MQEYFFEDRGIYYRKNDWLPERQTLVFIHGVSASSSAWRKYEEKFKNEYNVLTLDLRGHGKSKKYGKYREYKLQNFAIDLHELLVQLNVEKFIMISHSFGTIVSLEFLVDYQNMVEKIIFLSPVLDKKKWLGIFLSPLLSLINTFNSIQFSQKPSSHVDYSKYPNSSEWSPKRLFADIKNTGLRVYLFCIGQMCKFDNEKYLENINTPTLIIHGKKDTYSSVNNSVYMASKIKNSELNILESGTHIIVLNNFDEVSDIMEKFIKE